MLHKDFGGKMEYIMVLFTELFKQNITTPEEFHEYVKRGFRTRRLSFTNLATEFLKEKNPGRLDLNSTVNDTSTKTYRNFRAYSLVLPKNDRGLPPLGIFSSTFAPYMPSHHPLSMSRLYHDVYYKCSWTESKNNIHIPLLFKLGAALKLTEKPLSLLDVPALYGYYPFEEDRINKAHMGRAMITKCKRTPWEDKEIKSKSGRRYYIYRDS